MNCRPLVTNQHGGVEGQNDKQPLRGETGASLKFKAEIPKTQL